MNHINYYLLNFWSWVLLINKIMKKTDKNKKKFLKNKINFFSMNSIVLWIILTIIYSIFGAEYFLLIKWWKKLIKIRKNFEKKMIIFDKKNKFFLNELDSFMNHINHYLLNFWCWVFLINKMMKKTDKNKKKFLKKKINFFSMNSIVL